MPPPPPSLLRSPGAPVAPATQYVDEADGSLKRCVLHRDLKPDNVLVTEFNRGKIADFGTSRAKAASDDAIMTAVGTPLFAAPELMRGERYDEKVDVYSFGLTVADMADEEHIVEMLLERFRAFQGKPKRGRNVKRPLRAICEDGWEPFASADPATGGGGDEALPHAPPSIRRLVASCCAVNPAARPDFGTIVQALQQECSMEIEGAGARPWGRRELAAEGLQASGEAVRASPAETAAFVSARKRAGSQWRAGDKDVGGDGDGGAGGGGGEPRAARKPPPPPAATKPPAAAKVAPPAPAALVALAPAGAAKPAPTSAKPAPAAAKKPPPGPTTESQSPSLDTIYGSFGEGLATMSSLVGVVGPWGGGESSRGSTEMTSLGGTPYSGVAI